MNLERIKEFLQNYLDTVVSPKINEKREKLKLQPIEFTVFEILKGSYQPPMIHVFLHTEPEIKKTLSLKPHASMMLAEVEKDVEGFLKVFSINNKIKVHWNKTPIFNNGTIHTND
jgi:hypothetical protein